MMPFVLKMMPFVFKMMNSLFKMMNSLFKTWLLQSGWINGWWLWEAGIDLYFLVDVVMAFFTAFVDQRGITQVCFNICYYLGAFLSAILLFEVSPTELWAHCSCIIRINQRGTG